MELPSLIKELTFPGLLERGILLKTRFDLDLYVNLRPFLLPDEDIDFLVVRENTEGIYLGRGASTHVGTAEEEPIIDAIPFGFLTFGNE